MMLLSGYLRVRLYHAHIVHIDISSRPPIPIQIKRPLDETTRLRDYNKQPIDQLPSQQDATPTSIIENRQLRRPSPPSRIRPQLRRQRRRGLHIPPLRPAAPPPTHRASLPPPSLQPLRLIMQPPSPLTLLYRRQKPPAPRRRIPPRQSLVAQTALLHRPQTARHAFVCCGVGFGV